MRTIFTGIIVLFSCAVSYCQDVQIESMCGGSAFRDKVEHYLDHSIDVISVGQLHRNLSDYLLLDARERHEYDVSHIYGAQHFGYDFPRFEILDTIPKETPIVLYCSIGYRSEKMGDMLKRKGFSNVKNLYGSIFEWVNCGYDVVGPAGHSVKKVHGYNKRWSRWVNNEAFEVTY